MSESDRTPGYRNRSQVPPDASRDSRMRYFRDGNARCKWWAAPIPDRPAPTISTSTCSSIRSSPAPAAYAPVTYRPYAARGARVEIVAVSAGQEVWPGLSLNANLTFVFKSDKSWSSPAIDQQ